MPAIGLELRHRGNSYCTGLPGLTAIAGDWGAPEIGERFTASSPELFPACSTGTQASHCDVMARVLGTQGWNESDRRRDKGQLTR